LYISTDERVELRDGKYRIAALEHHPNAIIIASEPLTTERGGWQRVPENHLLAVTPELHVSQLPIK
jgi:predicted glutamine amidotransferase